MYRQHTNNNFCKCAICQLKIKNAEKREEKNQGKAEEQQEQAKKDEQLKRNEQFKNDQVNQYTSYYLSRDKEEKLISHVEQISLIELRIKDKEEQFKVQTKLDNGSKPIIILEHLKVLDDFKEYTNNLLIEEINNF